MTKGRLLRQTLDREGILLLPGVYDCLSAKLVEDEGFEVIFTSGFGISASTLGRPDFGFLTATEVVRSVGNIARAVRLPVVADIDTGYGNPLNVHRTVSEVVSLEIAGIILEDQEWPKKCGHFEGKRVIPCQEHVEKIHAAVEARGESGLVIIGRTDARAVEGLDMAIKRGQSYAEAGADVIFVEAPQSRDELKAISEAFPDVPTFANMIEGGRTPLLSAAELEELGFKIVVFPLTGLFSAAQAMKTSFRYLKQHGKSEGVGQSLTFGEFEDIIDVEYYRDMEKRFTPPED